MASKKLVPCRYSVKIYCRITNAIYDNLPYGLRERDTSITSEVELKDETVHTPAVGVARGKGTVRNESLIASLEVFRDH